MGGVQVEHFTINPYLWYIYPKSQIYLKVSIFKNVELSY